MDRVRSGIVQVGLTATLALALMPLSANVAWACLCDQVTPTDAARNAASVFTGTARGRVATERVGFGERVEFAVETVYKGGIASRVSVDIEPSSCGYVFADGRRYTVFATAEGRTSMCMGNVEGAIDAASYGVQPIAAYPSRMIDLARETDRLGLAAILAVVGLGAVLLMRLRHSRSD